MAYILTTFEVIKLDTSNEVNFEQFQNIKLIFKTFEVLKSDTSNEIILRTIIEHIFHACNF